MRLLGYEIVRRNGALMIHKAVPQGLQSLPHYWPYHTGYIHEPFTGAWGRNIAVESETSILAFSAVFACVTGIAADIAKMRIKLDRNENGIWTEITDGSPWLPVLRKPNHYQNRIKFIEQWIVSKLLNGNAYILKERDQRGVVKRLYVLNPQRVTTLVAEDGSVWYQLGKDPLFQVSEFTFDESTPTVPASEIIHDTMVALWHPLIGVTPIYACGMSATMGNKIQSNSTNLFGNGARPGGVLLVPQTLTQVQADTLKERWQSGFSGANVGKTAILENGIKYESIAMNGVDAQLIEQLRWTVDDVGRAFHYPLWKLGGTMPAYTKPELAMTSYYSDCLHPLIESLELCLDEGLELPADQGTEMDLETLMRMDTESLFASNNSAVGGGWMAPDEARFRANMKPVPGGDSPMIQQQNYSLAALAKRDAKADPFEGSTPKPPEPPPAKDYNIDDLALIEDMATSQAREVIAIYG